MNGSSTRAARRFLGGGALAALLLALAAAPAAAQDQAESMTNPPTLLKESLAAPKPGDSTISATAGLQIQNGITGTRGWTFTGQAAHTTSRHALVQFQAASNYASYRATKNDDYAKVEDNQNALFTYLHPRGPRFSWLGGAGWKRDAILAIDYRWWGEAGAGVTLRNDKKTYLLVGASVAGGRERRAFFGTDPVQDVGVLQILKWSPTAMMSIEEWVRSKHDVTDSSDYSTSFYVSIGARVTKHAGMKIYYQLDDEGLVPPDTANRQTTLGAGVEISFTRGAPAASGTTTPPAAQPPQQ
jgi:hypothetical protein